MILEIGQSITLSDNMEYIISSKIDYNGETYYMLSNKENIDNLQICYLTKEDDRTYVTELTNDALSNQEINVIMKLLSEEALRFLETA